MIRTRIAPSPTGVLHVGTARTALFNYLFAKQQGGEFVVRSENTDTIRSTPEYEADILAGLTWLGLNWDAFYRQSERTRFYSQALTELIANDRAYHDGYVIRFRNPGTPVKFEDLLHGTLTIETASLGDFVIAKSFTEPVYHFAVVVDDAEMQISHVIRGDDHLVNTARHILLQRALGLPQPQYAHLPMLLGPDRAKLSKRHGATAINTYRTQGYLPEAMVNFLALLGWNPGTDREIFTLEELVKHFDLAQVRTSAAIFDETKLAWMNSQYIKQMPLEDLARACQPYLPAATTVPIAPIIALEQPRLKKLSDITDPTAFFFQVPDYPKELLSWKGANTAVTQDALRQALGIVKMYIGPWTHADLDWMIKPILSSEDDKGRILWPLRVALSGQQYSPGPIEIMAILGKEETLRRIHQAITKP